MKGTPENINSKKPKAARASSRRTSYVSKQIRDLCSLRLASSDWEAVYDGKAGW